MASKIRYGKSEIVNVINDVSATETEKVISGEVGIQLIKFKGRYYTVYGRMFAVAGNHIETPYNEVCKMKHYGFTDWSTLENMYIDE